MKPINGVVYKATEVGRPHPKMAVMSDEEVREHQKHESVADVMQKQNCTRSIFIRTKKKENNKEKWHDSATMDIQVSNPPATEQPRTILEPKATPPISNSHDEPAGASHRDEKKKRTPFARVTKVLKRVLHRFELVNPPRCSPLEPITTNSPTPQVSIPTGHRHLRSGFHCSQNGCSKCALPSPSTTPSAPAAVPQISVRPPSLCDEQAR